MKTSFASIALVTLAVVISLRAVAQDSAQTTQPDELTALREQIEAQERHLEQQQKEIESLKAAVGRLVAIGGQNPDAGRNCVANDGRNCAPEVSSNAVTTTPSAPPQAGSDGSPEQNGKSRFMLGGDVRLRFEPIFQDLTPTRYRTRLRVRLGMEATLNQDLKAGFYLASGTLDDPVSTNVTLTQFFTRKSIGIDRGWITYQPVNHSLAGGDRRQVHAQLAAHLHEPGSRPESRRHAGEALVWNQQFRGKENFSVRHAIVAE